MSESNQEYFMMSPKVDFAFKEIMHNDKVRKGFLSAVLNIPVDDIKKTVLKNANLPKNHEDTKQGILDVYLIMNDNTEIDIEIQLSYMATWAERSAFYVSKMLVDQTNIDKIYSNFKKCIGINILDFKYVKETERFHTIYHIREDSENICYTDIMEWHLIELPKLPKTEDGTVLYDWIKFLKAEKKEEFDMAASSNEYIREAVDTLEVISQDEQKRLEYNARQKALWDYNTLMAENYIKGKAEGRAEGRAEGEARGMAKGIAKGRSDLLALMAADGVSEEIIRKYMQS